MKIFTFHNVIEDQNYDSFDAGLFTRLSATEFRKAIKYLQSKYNFISLSKMVAALNEGYLIPNAAAITFDDCYHSVIQSAFPVLESFEILATLFAITSYLDSHSITCFKFDQLEIAFRLSKRASIDCTDILPNFQYVNINSVSDKLNCLWNLKNYLKILPKNISDDIFYTILERLKVSEDMIIDYASKHSKYRSMNWNDLCEAKDKGHLIGSHTITHSTLTQLPINEAYAEIVQSRLSIINQLGGDWLPFAYPYGKEEHFSPEIHRIVSSSGYDCAVTTISGVNTIETDKFRMCRFELDQDTCI